MAQRRGQGRRPLHRARAPEMIPARARACRLVIALLLVGERVAAQNAPAPVDPWHGFAGLELSQSLDDVLASNAHSWQPLSAQPANHGFTPVRVADTTVSLDM